MLTNILASITFILSFILTLYNCKITSVQKTPVQQSWLSSFLIVQLTLMVVILFKNKFLIELFRFGTLVSLVYLSLYYTKFSFKETIKWITKVYILVQETYLSLLIMAMFISILNIRFQNVFSISTIMDFIIISLFLLFFITYNIFFIIGSYRTIKKTIIALGIILLILHVLSFTFFFTTLTFLVPVILSIFIILDGLIIKIIWIDRGRYYV